MCEYEYSYHHITSYFVLKKLLFVLLTVHSTQAASVMKVKMERARERRVADHYISSYGKAQTIIQFSSIQFNSSP